MLSKEQNERLTRVGPGTPMGTLMRRYWHPIATSAELPHPDCDPLRLGLLGEMFVVFRDTAGRVGGEETDPRSLSRRLLPLLPLLAPLLVVLFRLGMLPEAHAGMLRAQEQLARRRERNASLGIKDGRGTQDLQDEINLISRRLLSQREAAGAQLVLHLSSREVRYS